MAKFPSFPPLYNSALQISITKLKEWGYLEKGIIKWGTINWSRNGSPNGSISIRVNTQSEPPFIELDYKYKDEPRYYKVYLTSSPSNLKRGELWYFICPRTNKRCRKLYSIGGYFLHREAFSGCMYETQTQSKKYRAFDKEFGVYFDIDNLYDELFKKHLKKKYAGKPTKKYLRLMQQINRAESIPHHEIEKLMRG